MDSTFLLHAGHFWSILSLLTPEVCPEEAVPAQEPESPAEWAEKRLSFSPTPKQAEILNSESRYLILCCNRQWGKTTTIALKCLYRAIHNPGESIVILSRTKIQAGLLIEKACRCAQQLGHKISRVLGQRYSLALPNGSTILAVAHNEDTSAGNTAKVLVIDEAALVQDKIYAAVTYFTSWTRGAIWLLSTPRRQTGFFYNIWHGNDGKWHRVFSTVKDCPGIDPEFLRMQEQQDPVRYRQDFLCEFCPPANRLVSREALENLVDPTLDPWRLQPRHP